MGTQPDQTLRGDYCSAPNEGPFLAANVLVVEILRQIVSQEDGPDDDERPHVGMQGEWHFPQVRKVRMLIRRGTWE